MGVANSLGKGGTHGLVPAKGASNSGPRLAGDATLFGLNDKVRIFVKINATCSNPPIRVGHLHCLLKAVVFWHLGIGTGDLKKITQFSEELLIDSALSTSSGRLTSNEVRHGAEG